MPTQNCHTHAVVATLFAVLASVEGVAGDSSVARPADESAGAFEQGSRLTVDSFRQSRDFEAMARFIREEEYAITQARGGAGEPLSALNRSQGFRARFGHDGFRVEGGLEREALWAWSWSLAGFGRVGAAKKVEQGVRHSEGSRVEYRYKGFVEWYENAEFGLEQGFTIDSRPEGEGSLVIEGRIGEGLSGELDESGEYIRFVDEAGEDVMKYGGLFANDRNGATLPSRMAIDGRTLRLYVDDTAAVYPIVIDPTITATDSLWGFSTGFAGAFPINIEIHQDYDEGHGSIFLGATQFNVFGAVFQFEFNSQSIMTAPTRMVMGDQEGAGFGSEIAVGAFTTTDAWLLAVSAPDKDVSGDVDRGEVTYWQPFNNTFQLRANYVGSEIGSRFGISLRTAALRSDPVLTLIVGESGFDNDTGQVSTLTANDKGDQLATIPTSLLVGPVGGGEYGRFIHTYRYVDESGEEQPSLVVDAPNETVKGVASVGAARVYSLGYDAGIITPTMTNLYTGVHENQFFGCKIWYVAASGLSFLLLGEVDYNEQNDENGNGTPNEQTVGQVQAYLQTATGLENTSFWRAYGEPGNLFGWAVGGIDIDQDGFGDVAVSAIRANRGAMNNVGNIRAYFGNADGLPAESDCVIWGDQAEGLFGFDLAYGDLNFDDVFDIATTAPFATTAVNTEGVAYVIDGSLLSARTRRFLDCFGQSGDSGGIGSSKEASIVPFNPFEPGLRADLLMLLGAPFVLFAIGRFRARRKS